MKTSQKIEQVIADQGWNEDSVLSILRDFIAAKKMDGALLKYIEKRAKEENDASKKLDEE